MNLQTYRTFSDLLAEEYTMADLWYGVVRLEWVGIRDSATDFRPELTAVYRRYGKRFRYRTHLSTGWYLRSDDIIDDIEQTLEEGAALLWLGKLEVV